MKKAMYCDLFQAQTLFDGCIACLQKNGQPGCGIVSREKIIGMILGISDEIGRPVVLLQPVPFATTESNEDCTPMGLPCRLTAASKKFHRAEGRLYYSQKNYCADLRSECSCCQSKANDGERTSTSCEREFGLCDCFNLDSVMADTLLSLAKTGAKTQNGTIEVSIKGENQTVEYEYIKARKETEEEKSYILYQCPISKFYELAVLVQVGGICGVLLAGQVMFSDEKYRDKREELEKNLVDKDGAHYIVDYLVKTDFIKTVIKKVDHLQTQLVSLLKEKHSTKEDAVVSSAIKKLRDNWTEKMASFDFNSSNPILYNEAYEILKQILRDVITQTNMVGVPGIRELFGVAIEQREDESAEESMKRNVIIHPTKLIGESLQRRETVHLEESSSEWQVDNSDWSPAAKFIDPGEDFGFKIIGFRFSSERFAGESFTIEIKNVIVPDEYRCVKGTFLSVLGSANDIFRRVFQNFCLRAYGLVAASKAALLDTITAAIRHEIGQVYVGHLAELDHRKASLQSASQSNTLDGKQQIEKEMARLIENSESYAHSTMLRVASSRYIATLIPQPKWTSFFPYDAFLYKWRSQMITRLHEQNDKKPVWLDLEIVAATDRSRPKMYADRDMIEQIAYNLLNNAFKYAMNGTTITVDCRLGAPLFRDGEKINIYELVVQNFALRQHDMDKEKIFEFASRAKTIRTIEGSGLGLWFAREFARAHGGTLKVDISPVSDYNILDLKLLFSEGTQTAWKLANLSQEEAEKERQRLIKYGAWDCVDIDAVIKWISFERKKYNRPQTTDYFSIRHGLRQGTDQFTFTLRLPQVRLKSGQNIEDLSEEVSAE